MKLILILVVTFVASVTYAQEYPAVRDELLAMYKVDQDARIKCTKAGAADDQTKCLADLSTTIDVEHSKRLREIFDRIGFPNTAKVGAEGMQDFMILLQHDPKDDLRMKCLKPITAAFKKKEIPAMDYANFVDRLRLHMGKKQLYGSGFDLKDGKMILSPTEDMKNLEKRRAKIGLPPLAEYVKGMKELYHLEVVVPPEIK